MIVMNPPYGERISTPNLLGTYKMIGERLKHQFMGNEAWILSYREECFRQIGLKPSIKIPVYNGSLECEFRRYQMFDGKMSDFRHEGGVVKTEDEKREMAQKHRFKKEREFKKRLDENEENAEADIRSFTLHSLERNKFGGGKFREDRERLGLAPWQVVAMGDGANDIPMIREAGFGIAYRAKPKTEANADACVRFGGLERIRGWFA